MGVKGMAYRQRCRGERRNQRRIKCQVFGRGIKRNRMKTLHRQFVRSMEDVGEGSWQSIRYCREKEPSDIAILATMKLKE